MTAPRRTLRTLMHRNLMLATLVGAATACGGDEPTVVRHGDENPDPAQAVFVTSDIPRFWAAYDAGGSTGLAAPFQSEYLSRASSGLATFIASRNVTATSLATMVRNFPRYFADIRPNTLRLAADAALIGRMRDGYVRMKEIYPTAVFPPVTFLIGRFSTGGTTTGAGMLVGLEFYALGSTTPVDELNQFQRDNVRPLDSLPIIVAHEHVHILQERARGIFVRLNKNLLEQSLLEGSADFVGELVSHGNVNARLKEFGIPREAALWAEFQNAMHGTNISRWLYNQGSATPDRPGDLGYFIGYRIAEAYYNRMTDKRAAVRDIIEIRNADQFVTQSGYSP